MANENFVIGDEIYFTCPPQYVKYMAYAREFYGYYRGFLVGTSNFMFVQTVYANNESGYTFPFKDVLGKYFVIKASEFIPKKEGPVYFSDVVGTQKEIIPDQLPLDKIDNFESGYYFDNEFYKDANHTEKLKKVEERFYRDITSGNNTLYFVDENGNYVEISGGSGPGSSINSDKVYLASGEQLSNESNQRALNISNKFLLEHKCYTEVHNIASDTWIVNHGMYDLYSLAGLETLYHKPTVLIHDSNGKEIYGGVVEYTDDNTVTISFDIALTGIVNLFF